MAKESLHTQQLQMCQTTTAIRKSVHGSSLLLGTARQLYTCMQLHPETLAVFDEPCSYTAT